MRHAFTIIIFLYAAASCIAEPVAVWTPASSSGVELVSNADGQWEARNVSGREAACLKQGLTPPSYYLYFKLAPDVRQKLGSDVYMVVDFLDEGMGTVKTEYNSPSSPYTNGPGYLLACTGKWERAIIHYKDARFAGLQNAGTDFRLSYAGPITLSKLEVYSQKPVLEITSDLERLRACAIQSPKPKDMFYCFGNDADEVSAVLYHSLGVTSIESYVTWQSVESEAQGRWDWSRWDSQVEILRKNDLKWAPFLILGPAYSTPNWFRAGSDHFPCRCLEHGTASKIESLWNPNLPKWIDRFVSEFALRYGGSGMIEGVILGIQGDFGEAIYSVTGGGWTFDVPGEYHNHAGYWCDDPYALADFRKFIRIRYTTVNAVNKAWKTEFANLNSVGFPGRQADLKAFQDRIASGDPGVRRRWLDFIDWYRDSMTRWADQWMATARKYLPYTPIYLCTGGDANPTHGSNFAEQCRVAAKHGGGVRITNEASHYATNFAVTRWVASAGKHYGAYYGFEPAGAENQAGVVARIYNATASGANQLHDYNGNIANSTSAIETQRKHLKYLFRVKKPVVPVALWYPNVSLTLGWGGFLGNAAKLRDYTDFDFVDESMLRTGALSHYKILLIVQGQVMEPEDARRIVRWMRSGGRVLVADVPKFESVEGTDEPEKILFGDSPEGRASAKGGIRRVHGLDQVAAHLRAISWKLGLPVYDAGNDGVYGTQIGDNRFLFLNMGKGDAPVAVERKGKRASTTAPALTITEVDL